MLDIIRIQKLTEGYTLQDMTMAMVRQRRLRPFNGPVVIADFVKHIDMWRRLADR